MRGFIFCIALLVCFMVGTGYVMYRHDQLRADQSPDKYPANQLDIPEGLGVEYSTVEVRLTLTDDKSATLYMDVPYNLPPMQLVEAFVGNTVVLDKPYKTQEVTVERHVHRYKDQECACGRLLR